VLKNTNERELSDSELECISGAHGRRGFGFGFGGYPVLGFNGGFSLGLGGVFSAPVVESVPVAYPDTIVQSQYVLEAPTVQTTVATGQTYTTVAAAGC
jgi:hypothetical protein